MVLLKSDSIELGTDCPSFSLNSVDNKSYGLKDFKDSSALLVAFICNHCPYVRAIEDRLIAMRKAFSIEELAIVGICANDPIGYPDDKPENLYVRWKEKEYGFPYLIDAEQTVAKSFGAVCTPDLFLFDGERKLFYHGQLDDHWRDASLVKREYLKEAIGAILKKQRPPKEQKPSMGCSIKWR